MEDNAAEGNDNRNMEEADNVTMDGDGDRGRYSLMRCVSQSSLDESSQRPRGAAGNEDGGAGSQHAAKLLQALARLRREGGALCDVRLVARAPEAAAVEVAAPEAVSPDDEAAGVPAHRAVLAACSPYFRAMFTQFDERTQPVVTIQNVEPSALDAILDYVYDPDSLLITEDNVQSVLSAASLLQVSGARAACCAFLAGALSPDNALGIRAFADLHACTELAHAAAAYVDAHFVQVLDADEFLALEADALARLLESDRIAVPSEEVVLDGVVKWVQHDPERRRDALGALLERVRLPLVAQEALVARAAAEPLLGAGLRVKDLVIEALSYHLTRPERRAAAAAACARAEGHPRRGDVPRGGGPLARGRRAAGASLPRRAGRAGRARVRRGRLQRHSARAQRGRVRRGVGRVERGAGVGRAALDARRGGAGPANLRRGRLRRRHGAQLGGGAGSARGRVAAGGCNEHAALVRGRGGAGRAAVRRGRVRRRVAAVPAVGGVLRAGGGRVARGGADGGAALGRGRRRGGGRAVRRRRARRAGRAALGGALPRGRGLESGAGDGARAAQRGRGVVRRAAVRGGRRRRAVQPDERGGVRPGDGHVESVGRAHERGPLVRGRGVRGAAAAVGAHLMPRPAPPSRRSRTPGSDASRTRVCERGVRRGSFGAGPFIGWPLVGRAVGCRSVGGRSVVGRSVGCRSVGGRSVGSRSVGRRAAVGALASAGGAAARAGRTGGGGRGGRRVRGGGGGGGVLVVARACVPPPRADAGVPRPGPAGGVPLPRVAREPPPPARLPPL